MNQRENRISAMVTQEEQREVRMAAASYGVSMSEFARVAALALARGQLVPNPRLPGFEGDTLPAWLAGAR